MAQFYSKYVIFWKACIRFLLIYGMICNAVNSSKNDASICAELPFNASHLATKTGYAAVMKDASIREMFVKEVSETCGGSPVQLWLVTRHGTRYPIKSRLRKMAAMLPIIAQELVFNHKEGRGCLSATVAQQLEKFIVPYSLQDSMQLHETGADEQYSLGLHYKKLFPELLAEPYSVQHHKVEFTKTNRTSQSAYHFLRGVFGDAAVAGIRLPKARSPNYKLKAYSACPAWQRDVLHDKGTLHQQRLYEKQPEFLNTLRDVSTRLGYTEPVGQDELFLIYDECRYESAWHPDTPSIWCAAFAPNDIKVLVYHEALKYYYEDSYGGPDLNHKIACAAVADIGLHMRNVVKGLGAPRALLYFSHNKFLIQLYTLLGLHRPDLPLTHDNRQLQENAFDVSRWAAFSSNIAFVLYRCADDSFRVGGYQQGEPVSLSGLCPHETGAVTCSWPLELFEETADSCNVSAMCHDHDEL